MPATRTQVMSGQIDIGWAAPPFGLEAVNKGEIRILVTGADAEELNNVSVRVNVTSEKFLKERPKAALAFNRAYKESLDWMYANLDKALVHYARGNNIPVEVAKEAMRFYSKARMEPWPVSGLEHSVAEAVKAKRIDRPLTAAQLQELVVEVK
jgi:NitT/TauT family transport system substrate-binding protein